MARTITTSRLVLELGPSADSSFWPAYVAIRANPSWQQQVWHQTSPPEDPREACAKNLGLVERRGYGLWAISKRRDEAGKCSSPDQAADWIGWIGYRNRDDMAAQPSKERPPPNTLEVYIGLAREYWGHGYGTEALQSLVDDAFGTNRIDTRLTASILEDNPASEKCFASAGFAKTTEDLRYEDEGAYWVLDRDGWERNRIP
ncbi:acyl-CoA N-acyltransferase [Nemania serpens]|nr:acyl-CoA N-acyltransferase [Nemania serpens]